MICPGDGRNAASSLRILGWVRNPLQTITELCCGDLKAFYLNKIEQLQYSEISLGLLKPELAGEAQCKRFRVGGAFRKRRFSILEHDKCVALALDLPAHCHVVKMPFNSLQAVREV